MKKNKKLPVYKMFIDLEKEGSGVDFIAVVDAPAIEEDWFAFDKQEPLEFKFSTDNERKIIVAPAMIPNKLIYRRTDALGEFQVFFPPEEINKIQEKFMQNLYLNNVNKMHDSNKVLDGIFMKNSWVSDKSMGIHAPEMFKHLPDQTWFISYKFTDEKVWQEVVKTGQFKGVSVEGMFDLIPIEQSFEYQFANLINEIAQITNK